MRGRRSAAGRGGIESAAVMFTLVADSRRHGLAGGHGLCRLCCTRAALASTWPLLPHGELASTRSACVSERERGRRGACARAGAQCGACRCAVSASERAAPRRAPLDTCAPPRAR